MRFRTLSWLSIGAGACAIGRDPKPLPMMPSGSASSMLLSVRQLLSSTVQTVHQAVWIDEFNRESSKKFFPCDTEIERTAED